MPVVPSPTSLSYDFESSTINLATGCSISIFSTIVAPSFVTSTSRSGLTIILSIPLGPRELLRVLATDLAATILPLIASRPLTRFLVSYSRRIINGRPNSSNATLIPNYLILKDIKYRNSILVRY